MPEDPAWEEIKRILEAAALPERPTQADIERILAAAERLTQLGLQAIAEAEEGLREAAREEERRAGRDGLRIFKPGEAERN